MFSQIAFLQQHCQQSKIQGPNSTQIPSFFRAGKHHTGRMLEEEMQVIYAGLQQVKLGGETREHRGLNSRSTLSKPMHSGHSLPLLHADFTTSLHQIHQLRTWAVLLLTQHVGLAAAGSQSPTLFHHSCTWMGPSEPNPEPNLSLPSQC